MKDKTMTDHDEAVSNTPEATMRRIQALLERAAHPTTPGPEKEASQAAADRLMSKYRLDRALLNFAKDAKDRGLPEKREYEQINLIDDEMPMSSKDFKEEWGIENAVRMLRHDIYYHAECRMFSTHKIVSVVGFEEDLFFADLLWNTVFLDLTVKMFPRWTGSGSDTFDKNVFLLKNAGYSWPQVREAALKVNARDKLGPLTHANSSSKLRTAYARECKRIGFVPPEKQPRNPGLWRRSYIDSFRTRLNERFYEMKLAAKQDQQAAGEAGALALYQAADQVKDLFYEMFPDANPANWPKADPNAKKLKLPKVRQRAADEGAWAAGYSAASQINISNAKAAGDKKTEIS